MPDLFVFSNFAVSALQHAVDQFATEFDISVEDVERFPDLTGGSKFPIVLADNRDNFEICYVNTLSASGVMSVERAREGTSALSWAAGTQVLHTFTAASLLAAAKVNPKGEWSAATNYVPGDVVVYGGISYLATLASLNQVPGAGSAFWQVFYSPPGISSTALTWSGDWSSGTAYSVGNYVKYRGRLWVALAAGTGNTPEVGSGFWYALGIAPDPVRHSEPLVTTAAVNNYVVNPSPEPTALYDGMRLQVVFTNPNTTACTLQVGALAPQSLRPRRSVEFASGEIIANEVYEFVYFAATTEFVAISMPGVTSKQLAQDNRLTALEGSNTRMPVGAVMDFAGAAAPAGWLLCFGQAVSRVTYAALFAAIGTTYGAGDGSTTFNLPDCRGRATFGKNDMGGTSAGRLVSYVAGNTLGAVGGSEHIQQHQHTHNNPVHSHGGSVAAGGGHDHNYYRSSSSGTGQAQGGSNSPYDVLGINQNWEATEWENDHTHGLPINNSGIGLAIGNVSGATASSEGNIPPAIVLNKIIFTGV